MKPALDIYIFYSIINLLLIFVHIYMKIAQPTAVTNAIFLKQKVAIIAETETVNTERHLNHRQNILIITYISKW